MYPLPDWERNDLEKLKCAIATKPPNISIEHPTIAGFLAGFFQAMGELGYLRLETWEGHLHVPFLSVSGDPEVIDKFVRLIGDVQERIMEDESSKITVTGLRAIIFLRIVSPMLIGKMKKVAEKIIQYGYKISSSDRVKRVIKELGVEEQVEEVQKKPIRISKRVLVKGLGVRK